MLGHQPQNVLESCISPSNVSNTPGSSITYRKINNMVHLPVFRSAPSMLWINDLLNFNSPVLILVYNYMVLVRNSIGVVQKHFVKVDPFVFILVWHRKAKAMTGVYAPSKKWLGIARVATTMLTAETACSNSAAAELAKGAMKVDFAQAIMRITRWVWDWTLLALVASWKLISKRFHAYHLGDRTIFVITLRKARVVVKEHTANSFHGDKKRRLDTEIRNGDEFSIRRMAKAGNRGKAVESVSRERNRSQRFLS